MIATAAAVTVFAWPVITQLAAFDERSQAANFPLVIPQAMIPIGYTLDGASRRGAADDARPSRAVRRRRLAALRQVATMGYFVYFALPVILLIIGFPIFLILLVTSIVAVLTVADVPTEAIQTYMFGSLDNFPLLAVPFFVLAGEIMAQGGIARRVIAMVMAIVGGMRGSLAVTTVAASELFGAMSHTAVGTVVAMGRMIYPVAQGRRLQRPLRRRAHRLVGRDCRRHSAVDRDDPLRHLGGAIGGAVVHGRHPAEPSDRRHRCRLCDGLCQVEGRAARRPRALGDDLEDQQGCELGGRLARRDLRRHLWRRLHADRGGRRRGGLFALRHHVHLSRGRHRRSVAHPDGVRLPHLADPAHRDRRPASIRGC